MKRMGPITHTPFLAATPNCHRWLSAADAARDPALHARLPSHRAHERHHDRLARARRRDRPCSGPRGPTPACTGARGRPGPVPSCRPGGRPRRSPRVVTRAGATCPQQIRYLWSLRQSIKNVSSKEPALLAPAHFPPRVAPPAHTGGLARAPPPSRRRERERECTKYARVCVCI